jgi:hypothetical protein
MRTVLAIVIACLPSMVGWLYWRCTEGQTKIGVASIREAEERAWAEWSHNPERYGTSGSRPAVFRFGDGVIRLQEERRRATDEITFFGNLAAAVFLGFLGVRCKYWLGVFTGLCMFVSYMLLADAIGGMIALFAFPILCIGLIWIAHMLARGVSKVYRSCCRQRGCHASPPSGEA